MSFFLKGLILGFLMAIPVGPIAILCIRRTLQHGMRSGVLSGIGAAVADAIYAAMAAFSLTLIYDFIIHWEYWLKLLGAVFLLYLGGKMLVAKAQEELNDVPHKNLVHDMVSTFLLTITNPIAVLAFLAIFAGFGLSKVKGNAFEASILVVGVFLGSSAWWLLLGEGVSLFRKKIGPRSMLLINRISGTMIVLVGMIVLVASII